MSVQPLKNKKLSLVKLSDSALKVSSQVDLKQDIVYILNSISGLNELKSTKYSRLIKIVCELIENADYKPSSDNLKLNKKQIALESLFSIFPEMNNDRDKADISERIDFICEESLIKQIPKSTVIVNSVGKWALKKFL